MLQASGWPEGPALAIERCVALVDADSGNGRREEVRQWETGGQSWALMLV